MIYGSKLHSGTMIPTDHKISRAITDAMPLTMEEKIMVTKGETVEMMEAEYKQYSKS